MTPTEQNTLALIWNTYWIQISIIVAIIIFILGLLRNKTPKQNKNIIKSTKNKSGKIMQDGTNGQDNIIDKVNNNNGTIVQK